jgi:PAS domain S-box-containing protein
MMTGVTLGKRSRKNTGPIPSPPDARLQNELRASELSYRRLFEAANDGILILDLKSGRINDVNPFLCNLLGFSRHEMLGKTVAEVSPFKDIEPNQAMLAKLQKEGCVRYDDLPLETRDGHNVAVEFVSNGPKRRSGISMRTWRNVFPKEPRSYPPSMRSWRRSAIPFHTT